MRWNEYSSYILVPYKAAGILRLARDRDLAGKRYAGQPRDGIFAVAKVQSVAQRTVISF